MLNLCRSPDRRREDSPADSERLRRLRRYEELDRQLLLEKEPKGEPLDDDDEGDSPVQSRGGWSPEQHSRPDREDAPSAPQVSGFSSSFSFSGSQPSGFGGSNFGFGAPALGDSRQGPSTSGQSNSGQSDYWSHKRKGNWN